MRMLRWQDCVRSRNANGKRRAARRTPLPPFPTSQVSNFARRSLARRRSAWRKCEQCGSESPLVRHEIKCCPTVKTWRTRRNTWRGIGKQSTNSGESGTTRKRGNGDTMRSGTRSCKNAGRTKQCVRCVALSTIDPTCERIWSDGTDWKRVKRSDFCVVCV